MAKEVKTVNISAENTNHGNNAKKLSKRKENTMELVSMQTQKQFQFYAAGTGNTQTDFAVIPRHMVNGADEIETPRPWNRAVCFGSVARVANALVKKGVSKFKLARGRLRENSFVGDEGETIENFEIVVHEFEGAEAKKLLKKLADDVPVPGA